MTVVTDDFVDVVAVDAVVTVVLSGSGGERIDEAYDSNGATILTSYVERPADDGTWSVALTSNDSITPTGTRWRRTVSLRDGHESTTYANVPSSGTHEWSDILTDAPGAVTDGALSVHLADTDAHDLNGRKAPIVHVWQTDTWGRFDTQWVVNQHLGQSYALSVSGGRGRFAPTSTTGGNYREWRLDSAASFTNSEIRSLWYGQASDTDPCQVGHVHRATFDASSSTYKAFVVWANVAFGILSSVQLNSWEANSTDTLLLGTGISHTDNTSVDRTVRIRYAKRLNVFDISQYWCLRDDLYGLTTGDVVNITQMADGTFNKTDATLAGVNGTGFFQVTDTTNSDATDANAHGIVFADLQMKRYFPYMMASRLIGTTLQMKRWRPEDPEPDWGHPLAVTSATIGIDGAMTALGTGAGYNGLLLAHGLSGSYGEYGMVSIRELE